MNVAPFNFLCEGSWRRKFAGEATHKETHKGTHKRRSQAGAVGRVQPGADFGLPADKILSMTLLTVTGRDWSSQVAT
jgi:hypothetical protein